MKEEKYFILCKKKSPLYVHEEWMVSEHVAFSRGAAQSKVRAFKKQYPDYEWAFRFANEKDIKGMKKIDFEESV